jgi:hypothetical protein
MKALEVSKTNLKRREVVKVSVVGRGSSRIARKVVGDGASKG